MAVTICRRGSLRLHLHTLTIPLFRQGSTAFEKVCNVSIIIVSLRKLAAFSLEEELLMKWTQVASMASQIP